MQIKNVPKSGKIHNLLDTPPPLGCSGLFWIWEKFEIWRPPPPRTWFGKNLKLGKFWTLGTPLKKRNISLKHLKLPKNHFKTNLFFVHLKHLQSTFTFGGKKWKSNLPKVQILNFEFWQIICTESTSQAFRRLIALLIEIVSQLNVKTCVFLHKQPAFQLVDWQWCYWPMLPWFFPNFFLSRPFHVERLLGSNLGKVVQSAQ